MKNAFKRTKYLVFAGLLIIAFTAAAWQIDNKKKTDTTTKHYAAGDTTEPKQRNNDENEFRMNELKDAMKELDVEMQNLDLHMKDLNLQLSKQLNEAINKIDFEKINKQIDEQMKKIDVDKMKIDINKSIEEAQDQIKNIDIDKIKEVNNSIQQVHDQLKQIDMRKLQNEMLELQQNRNSSKFKMQIQGAMRGANESMERAKQELKDMQEFTDQLEKDGLIDKKKGYNVEWKKEGDLYINGKKQSKEISDKYSRYYRKDGYKIEMSGDSGKHKEFL